MADDQYRIVAIVQTTPDKEALKTVYLAEFLNLSVDRPTNLYRFDISEAKRKLLKNFIIKDADVKKIRPGTIYIDYVLRKPIAYLADFKNTAIDSEGVLFPAFPFFTPKKLPEVYLGLLSWEQCLHEHKSFQLMTSLLRFLEASTQEKSIYLKYIDVSRAYAPSFGQREIIILIEDSVEQEFNGRFVVTTHSRFLRLNKDNYERAWRNYLLLRDRLKNQKGSIIDLRIPHLAFIKEEV